MTEAQFRSKVVWYSFVLSLFVVWIHSYNAALFLGGTAAMADVYRAEHLIGDTLGQVAVPGFFMLSGYLFYRGFVWGKLPGKWRRRIQSVLVPYIVWNFIYYIGYAATSRLPWLTEVVGKGIVPVTLAAAVEAVISHTYNYVFWYLRQLIALILLAPLLYPVLKRKPLRILFLAAVWLAAALGINLVAVNADALFYYAAAGACGLAAREAAEAAESRRRTMAALGLLAAAALFFSVRIFAYEPGFVVLSRLSGAAALWLLLPGGRLPAAPGWMKDTFFLYATHFAVVRFINKAAALTFSVTKWEPFFLFLVMPGLAFFVSTALAGLLRRFLPRVWMLLNGGR